MSLIKKAKMVYAYGELEQDYNRCLQKNWLTQSDMDIASKEFSEIKGRYENLNNQFITEDADELIARMKKLPVNPFLIKKEKFLARFEEWKNNRNA